MAYLLCSLLNSSSISLGAVVSFDMAITSMLLQSLSMLCDAYCLWCLHTGELCFERKKKAWIYLEIRILKKRRRGRRRKEGGGGGRGERGEGKQNSKLDKRGCEILNFGQCLGPLNQWQNSCAGCSGYWVSLFLYFWAESRCCSGIK